MDEICVDFPEWFSFFWSRGIWMVFDRNSMWWNLDGFCSNAMLEFFFFFFPND